MGTCGSKCCFTSPPTTPCISEEPGSPDDKAVIFSSDHPLPPPLAATPIPSDDPFPDSPKTGPFKVQVHPSPPVVSSSSSSSSVSTSASTGTSTTTASYSSSSSYSTDNNSFDSRPNNSGLARPPLRRKSFSNEFLLSCVENSNIVILDPARSGSKQKPVQDPISMFSGIPVTASMQHLTASSLRQRTTTMRNNEPSNAKRARSVSPASRSGRNKFIRPDPGSWSQVNSNIARPRTGDLPPPQWRPVNYNSQRASSNASSGPDSRPVSADKRDFKVPTTAIEAKEREMRDGEAISRERARTPPLVEDLNNPLIAMDCFIFL